MNFTKEELKAAWNESFEIGFSTKTDWTEYEKILENDTRALVWSKFTKHLPAALKVMDVKDTNIGMATLLQHAKIPNDYPASLLRLRQIAFNAGYFSFLQKSDNSFTAELLDFYYDNNLDKFETYIKID